MRHSGIWIILALAGACAQVQAGEAASKAEPYIAARIIGGQYQIGDQAAYSVRAQGISNGPSAQGGFNGSVALGYQLGEDWRIEGEYVVPTGRSVETQWRFRNPANGFTGVSRNVLAIRSQRLMFNVVRSFPVTDAVALYGGAGIGLARVQADGYQNVTSRRFETSTRHNLAAAVTLGVQWRVDDRYTLGAGYRYADLGRYQSGRNIFLNNASGQRDEQHRGRLREQSVFAELRVAF